MKRILIAALVLLVGAFMPARAASQFDGIYSCTITPTGAAPFTAYITITTNATGDTIYVFAALSSFSTAFGYGLGRVDGGTFSGTTSTGGTFRGTLTGNLFQGIAVAPAGNTAANVCLKIF